MSNITLEGIAALLSEELRPINTRLETIGNTLISHTAALEQLLTEKRKKDQEIAVSAERFERLEHWAQQVGDKLDIKLEL